MQQKALEVLLYPANDQDFDQLQPLLNYKLMNVRVEEQVGLLSELLQEENFDILVYHAKSVDVGVSRLLRQLQSTMPTLFIVVISDLAQLPAAMNVHYHIPESSLGDTKDLLLHLDNISRIASLHKRQAELSGMLLHDLRSPAQSIIGYFELLEQEVFGPVNEGQRQIMLSAMALGDSIIELMEELGQVYQFEKHQFELLRSRMDLRTIIDDVLRFHWPQADRKNIKFIRQIADQLPAVDADSMAVQRVFTNLLQNAIRYSPENSTVRIKAFADDEKMVELEISDSGPGIPEDQIDHIFDKYFRIIDYKNKQKGQGLGLYICRLIVEAHGGTIAARNNEEKGMTFRFSLPVAPEKA